MTRKKKIAVRLSAILLAILMPTFTGIIATAGTEEVTENTGDSVQVKYESADINALTGHGEEPEDISVSVGATYQEKQWYEYVRYSDKAVASYRVDDDCRLLFYDPYTYTNAMIMDVEFDATTTEFDTMSSYTISHTTSKTMSSATSSTYTSSTAQQSSGRDYTNSEVTNEGSTKTIYGHTTDSTETGGDLTTKNYGSTITTEESGSTQLTIHDNLTVSAGIDANFAANEFGAEDTFIENWGTVTTDTSGTGSITTSTDVKTNTKYTGEDTVEYNTNSTTEGWTELSDRITKTLGSSRSTSKTWSETESTTVSKTYVATHFASDGVTPLPWALVHYTVQMPMKCKLQYKYDGDWITVSTTYCMITTIKGTCRAWIQEGQTYYEDWGCGEPVVATDFWSQFMSEEELIKAYTDNTEKNLYPVGGDD